MSSRPVERSEILDYVTYEERRDAIRREALDAKMPRRIIVGDYFTFLFENHTTIRYQVLEMVRTEKMVKEADIHHELATYNELLGRDGGLGCTLLIGIESEEERNEKLRAWKGLLETLYLELEDGARVRATWDPRQVGDDRLSSVQYLQFPVGGVVPVAIGVEHPGVEIRTPLTDEQRAALAVDLG